MNLVVVFMVAVYLHPVAVGGLLWLSMGPLGLFIGLSHALPGKPVDSGGGGEERHTRAYERAFVLCAAL